MHLEGIATGTQLFTGTQLLNQSVAAACPVVVHPVVVHPVVVHPVVVHPVVVHPVVAASKQTHIHYLGAGCAVHLIMAPGAERHQVCHVVFRHVANVILAVRVLLRQQVVHFLR